MRVPAAESWRRQEAAEQARRRDTNEWIMESMQRTGLCPANSFFCECGDPLCGLTVHATMQEYESVRKCPTHFMVAANHENPEVECVISESKRFAVVETLIGEPSKVALRTAPRSLHAAEWN